MHNQRVKRRPLLDLEDPGYGVRIESYRGKPIDRLGGNGHHLTGSQQLGSFPGGGFPILEVSYFYPRLHAFL